MKTRSNTFTLEQFKEKNYGAKGTLKREKLEAGYQNFKLGALLQEARLSAGLTQEELAEKVGTTRSYISKLENDIKLIQERMIKWIDFCLVARENNEDIYELAPYLKEYR